MSEIEIAQASERLLELTDEVLRGGEVLITRGDGKSFKLVPARLERKPRPRFGSAKGEVWMSDDFDAPLDDFKAYTP